MMTFWPISKFRCILVHHRRPQCLTHTWRIRAIYSPSTWRKEQILWTSSRVREHPTWIQIPFVSQIDNLSILSARLNSYPWANLRVQGQRSSQNREPTIKSMVFLMHRILANKSCISLSRNGGFIHLSTKRKAKQIPSMSQSDKPFRVLG